MKTIVFDVDGVLANFITAFTALGNWFFDTPIIDNFEQPSWNFRDSLTADEQNIIWERLRHTPEWWDSLASLVSIRVFLRISDLTLRHEVYFLTNRFSEMRPPGEQTVSWLKRHGISNPRVIVSSRKGEICSALNADFSLEDNWGNACAIHWMAGRCRSFLIERRHNEKAREIIPQGITVVKKVEEFLDYIEQGERA